MVTSETAYRNAITNLKECRDRVPVLTSYPLKLYIEPTSACNLRCTYCYPPENHLAKRMDMNLFYAIETQFFKHVCEVNLFLSGEPVLHSNFSEMLDICAKYPFITKFFSNLSYDNDKLLKKMVEAGSWVNVSLDGIESIGFRDGCDIPLILSNIRKLLEFQRQLKNDRFHLRIAAVVGKHNVTSLCSLIDWASSMGIREIMLGCLDAPERIIQHKLTGDDVDYFNQAVYRAELHGIRISTPSHIGGVRVDKSSNWEDFNLDIDKYFPHFCEDCNPDVETKFCPYPWIQTCIEATGEVVSCCQRKISLGKFTPDTDFITEIWNNAAYQNLRAIPDYSQCKHSQGDFCNMIGYSIWGGERRLNNIPDLK